MLNKLMKHWKGFQTIQNEKEPLISQEDWFKTVCESYQNPPIHIGNETLPAFPSDTLQINTTGQAGIATLKEAFIFYEDCISNFHQLGMPIKQENQLLDFGVGWGRISRFFLRELPLSNIHGVDVMSDFVAICKETFRSNNFYQTNPFPPTDLPNGMFNFIIGYSVFSHLSEEACAQWMKEFHRITTPHALIALTTRGRSFFDYCESLKGKGMTGYSDALSRMFENFDDARKKYDHGEFIHSNREGITGGGAMTADFYGETFIPRQYAEKAYSEHFTLEKFVFDQARQTHPIMFFRRNP